MVRTLFSRGLLICSFALPSLAANHIGSASNPELIRDSSAGNTNESHAGVNGCANSQSQSERDDCVRNSVRPYLIGPVKSIKIKNSKYFDADGRVCADGVGPRLTEARVRYFIKNSVPVSQINLMNYYSQQGECASENVKIIFFDGRVAHFSLSSEGRVGYFSPLKNGKEIDVFFYYCDQCSK